MARPSFGKAYTFVVLLSFVNAAFGCNAYKLKTLKVENCAGADGLVVVDPDFSVKLNKKCEVIPTGCVQYKSFTTAEIKYTLKKDNIVIKEGTADLCAAAEGINEEGKKFMTMFALPDKCPVEGKKLCAEGRKFDISKWKNLLPMAIGRIDVDFTGTYDTGKSCYHAEVEVSK